MVKVWVDPPSLEDKWWGEFNYAESAFPSSDLLDPKGRRFGQAVVDIADADSHEVSDWDVIPTTSTTRLVSSRFRAVLLELTGEQLVFVSATCRCRDGRSVTSYFGAPVREVPCVDVQRSEIRSWIVPGRVVAGHGSVRLRDGCVEAMGIVRDSLIAGLTIVGDELAEALCRTEFRGLCFVEDKSVSPTVF